SSLWSSTIRTARSFSSLGYRFRVFMTPSSQKMEPPGKSGRFTLIDAPSSTKNKEKLRDPEMSQTRKGNQWYFAVKAHTGTDPETG
ncbi:MAG: hypothetical protein M0Z32_07830, partial [Actinomycetota bacterium]|nr:hypothetical protein [Actinomycetota bacterium]MDA8167635.1 hypothetical protein [Actinomycetota bacterium]